jgi:hypothetical protein
MTLRDVHMQCARARRRGDEIALCRRGSSTAILKKIWPYSIDRSEEATYCASCSSNIEENCFPAKANDWLNSHPILSVQNCSLQRTAYSTIFMHTYAQLPWAFKIVIKYEENLKKIHSTVLLLYCVHVKIGSVSILFLYSRFCIISIKRHKVVFSILSCT